jgi:hypothetical protein
MTVFWGIVVRSLLKFPDVYEVLAAYIVHVMALMAEEASTSETSVNSYQTT